MEETYEDHTDQNDPFLSEISFAAEEDKVSVYTYLFSVWVGSNPEIRSFKRKFTGSLENSEM